jgi:tetratricopeptide (TPR) repeat protein
MKNNCKGFSNIFWLSILVLLGGVGSIISGFYTILGGILTLIGVIVSIYSLVSSELTIKGMRNLLETQAMMMARSGVGNIYLELINREIERKGFCDTTIDFLFKALELDPNNIDAIEKLSLGLTVQISFQTWVDGRKNIIGHDVIRQIRELAKRGWKIDPNRPSFYMVLGVLRDLEGKHLKARYWFKKSAKFRNDPYWRLAMSTSWGMSGDYVKALEEIETAIKEGAKRWTVDFYYGRTLVSLGQYGKAIFYLKKAYSQNSYQPEILQFFQTAYYMQGFFIKAALLNLRLVILLFFLSPRKCFRHLVEVIKLCFLALIFRISKLIWIVFKKLSLLAMIQVKILPPDEPEKTLATMMFEQGHFEPAADFYKRALVIYPENIRNLNNLAACLVKLGKSKEAIKVLDRALLIDPQDGVLISNKINIQRGL